MRNKFFQKTNKKYFTCIHWPKSTPSWSQFDPKRSAIELSRRVRIKNTKTFWKRISSHRVMVSTSCFQNGFLKRFLVPKQLWQTPRAESTHMSGLLTTLWGLTPPIETIFFGPQDTGGVHRNLLETIWNNFWKIKKSWFFMIFHKILDFCCIPWFWPTPSPPTCKFSSFRKKVNSENTP